MPDLAILPLTPADADWVEQFCIEHWGAPTVAGHGMLFRPRDLPGFVAEIDGERVGLVTYHLDGPVSCEIVTIDSLRPAAGIGTALFEAVVALARDQGCSRVWLITTNDNLTALRFYQRRGFVLVALHRNAVDASRRLKPEIPLSGEYGIPIRDELELEYDLCGDEG
jgi:GNAT superfamily N-acetyltransferase